MTKPTVYLAGPDVFRPDAAAIGERKREICARHGLIGRFPLDNDVHPPSAPAIFGGNLEMMRSCEAIVANLTPFRGPSADPGTAFELGFTLALGKRLFGYSNRRGELKDRIAPDGLVVEDFGLFDNLMLAEALAATGGVVVPDGLVAEPERDLAAFDACVARAASFLVRDRTRTAA